jgi:aspartate racemase
VVTSGPGTAEHRATLSSLAHTLIERDNVEAVVLAGTELALVFDSTNTDFPAIDCAAIYRCHRTTRLQ